MIRHSFFSYRAARIWNGLPKDSTNFSSLIMFKRSLSSNVLARYCKVYFLVYVILYYASNFITCVVLSCIVFTVMRQFIISFIVSFRTVVSAILAFLSSWHSLGLVLYCLLLRDLCWQINLIWSSLNPLPMELKSVMKRFVQAKPLAFFHVGKWDISLLTHKAYTRSEVVVFLSQKYEYSEYNAVM